MLLNMSLLAFPVHGVILRCWLQLAPPFHFHPLRISIQQKELDIISLRAVHTTHVGNRRAFPLPEMFVCRRQFLGISTPRCLYLSAVVTPPGVAGEASEFWLDFF